MPTLNLRSKCYIVDIICACGFHYSLLELSTRLIDIYPQQLI